MPAGDLGFCVMLYTISALIALGALIVKRRIDGGELGGSNCSKYGTAGLMVGLWFIYIMLASLNAYGMSIY